MKLLSVRHYKAGYEVHTIEHDDCPGLVSKEAYTPEGHYIGSSITAHRLVAKRGIRPELAVPGDTTCTIGFCPKELKWYGWSHRALYGFGIGHVTQEGDACTLPGYTEEYLVEHPEADVSVLVGFVAETLADCRRLAVAFAERVG